MAQIAAIVVVGVVFAGYFLCRRQFGRRAIVVVASAALLLPVVASNSSSATPSHHASPVVLEAKALPGHLPGTGGTVTVVGQVRNASTCRVVVLRDSGVKVTLPKPTSCETGTYRESVTFVPTGSHTSVVVKLGLLVGRTRGLFYVSVAGNPAAPEVLDARANPSALPAQGGWTTVVGKVRFASTCHLVALDWHHGALPSQNCSHGNFSEKIWLSPNKGHGDESQAFELVATGARGTAKAKFFARLAPAPLPPAIPTATVATTTSTPPLTSGISTGPFFPVLPPETLPATTTTTNVVEVRAHIDPTYSLPSSPQAPPLPVTFTYSATSGSGVPDGSLTLNVYYHGTETSVADCSANVGGSTTSTTCTATLPAWGSYDLVAVYSTSSPDAVSTPETITLNIEPPVLPPLTETEMWGTTVPTNDLAISAVVNKPLTADAVTITDSNFEGASSVTVTDNLGHKCGATISGTTASCTMPNVGAPTSFTVAYPGGAPQTVTETASPWGVAEEQQVTYTWPAQSVQVSNPSVTVPTTTQVTEAVTQIDAYSPYYNELAPSPCGAPTNYECVALGVQGLPTEGTVSFTTTLNTQDVLNGAKGTTTLTCSLDLSTATVCYTALPDLTSAVTTSPWTVTASWSGYSTGSYDVTDYSAPTVTFTMRATPNGATVGPTSTTATGTWWNQDGTAS